MSDRTARIAALQQRINEVKDRIFAPFSKQVRRTPFQTPDASSCTAVLIYQLHSSAHPALLHKLEHVLPEQEPHSRLPIDIFAKGSATSATALPQVGVANIREYETRHLQAAEKANLERSKLKMQVCFFTSQFNRVLSPRHAE